MARQQIIPSDSDPAGWGPVPSIGGDAATSIPDPITGASTTSTAQADTTTVQAIAQKIVLPPPPAVVMNQLDPSGSLLMWAQNLIRRMGGYVASPVDDAIVLADTPTPVDQWSRQVVDALQAFSGEQQYQSLTADELDQWGDSGRAGTWLSQDYPVVHKETGRGIKVDPVTPTWGWRDLLGDVRADSAGANRPTLAVFRGGAIRQFFYSAGDLVDMEFHIPHDYVPGTDIYAHVHWSHNGTAISGNFVATLYYTYAKGHNQAIFPAEKTTTITYATVNIGTTPQYIHRIDEVVISSAGGSGSLLDNAQFEVDGVVMMNLTMTTIPTITGGSTNEPVIFYVDLHYQSTNLATKAKAPSFYV